MRKPQDMKILRALGKGPRGWRELLALTRVSNGGLSYILNKLKDEKQIEQSHRGGVYYLTLSGETELRKRALVEGLEDKNSLGILKEGTKGELVFLQIFPLEKKTIYP